MPRFSNELPAEGKHHGFDLKRTPTTGALQAIITCDDLLVCDTHFWHGRTTPCEREVNEEGRTIDDTRCPGCREKQAWRSHVYVSCFDAKRAEHFIYECTAHAAKPLAEYRDTTTTLRGCAIHASRPKGTPNGKVFIITNAINLARVKLPQPPDLIRALAVIWRLPATALNTANLPDPELAAFDGSHAYHETVTTDNNVLQMQRQQPDNQESEEQFAARQQELADNLATAAAEATTKKGRKRA
jgi:hypothetical protein